MKPRKPKASLIDSAEAFDGPRSWLGLQRDASVGVHPSGAELAETFTKWPLVPDDMREYVAWRLAQSAVPHGQRGHPFRSPSLKRRERYDKVILVGRVLRYYEAAFTMLGLTRAKARARANARTSAELTRRLGKGFGRETIASIRREIEGALNERYELNLPTIEQATEELQREQARRRSGERVIILDKTKGLVFPD